MVGISDWSEINPIDIFQVDILGWHKVSLESQSVELECVSKQSRLIQCYSFTGLTSYNRLPQRIHKVKPNKINLLCVVHFQLSMSVCIRNSEIFPNMDVSIKLKNKRLLGSETISEAYRRHLDCEILGKNLHLDFILKNF